MLRRLFDLVTETARRRSAGEEPTAGAATEAERARTIQFDLLPRELPTLPGHAVAGHWQPARSVGGDYYDVWLLDPRRAVLCIADVAGKGLPAALLMADLQASLRSSAAAPFSPAALCARLNARLAPAIGRGRFVTLFVGLLDLDSGRLLYANAGHPPPLLWQGTLPPRTLDATGPALGLTKTIAFGEEQVTLRSGDRLLLVTDGVPEGGVTTGEPFGQDRMAAALHEYDTPQQLLRALAAGVAEATGGADLHDDVTMLAIYRLA